MSRTPTESRARMEEACGDLEFRASLFYGETSLETSG